MSDDDSSSDEEILSRSSRERKEELGRELDELQREVRELTAQVRRSQRAWVAQACRLRSRIRYLRHRVSVERDTPYEPIARAVARFTGVSVDELLSPLRTYRVVLARRIFWYHLRRAGLSYPAIGRVGAGWSHGDVVRGLRVLTKRFVPTSKALTLNVEAEKEIINDERRGESSNALQPRAD